MNNYNILYNKMKIKPFYPKNLFKDSYINGFYNGMITGLSLLLLFSDYKFLAMFGLGTAFIYYLLNYE